MTLTWILTGTGNKLRYVDVSNSYEQLGSSLCRSLPGYYAITGCDYNPAFFKKGKQRLVTQNPWGQHSHPYLGPLNKV